jgi:hypothetical protein
MGGSGSLICVGVGMTLGSHITPLARSYIENAEVVVTALADGGVERWLRGMHPDARSLQVFYREGKSCRDTHREMLAALLTGDKSPERFSSGPSAGRFSDATRTIGCSGDGSHRGPEASRRHPHINASSCCRCPKLAGRLE